MESSTNQTSQTHSPAIYDPCPKCNADAWCRQTLKQTTVKGTPNPFYLKWWTKCPGCGFSRNYDNPPEGAVKDNKRTFDQMMTSSTDVSPSMSVSAQLTIIMDTLNTVLGILKQCTKTQIAPNQQ